MTAATPERGTPEHRWWVAGAEAEAAARRAGRSKAGLQVLSLADALAKHHQAMDEAEIAATIFRICALPGTGYRHRVRLSLWILHGARGPAPRTAQTRS
ncbi:hypothetical protein OOK29_26010 [Streptomyces phaeochromogenes]|uniref:hypothetical protein n=1 Tax=Streptomyces phaeochromogenes TaxID=1923 RepID=UPI00225740E6|nr:hypothetical protein [Streptomyces phaeochromogenes]MCX5601610.1 hypothetical protein [Streptomyces phaeochromogenes]